MGADGEEGDLEDRWAIMGSRRTVDGPPVPVANRIPFLGEVGVVGRYGGSYRLWNLPRRGRRQAHSGEDFGLAPERKPWDLSAQ
ncbi:hypothetical protein GCM10018966_102340 [Streptomyces yanii]